MAGQPSTRMSSVSDLERAISAIVTWSIRGDVQQETMRRAKCDLPPGSVWVLSMAAKSGPVRLSDLAAKLGVDASTLTPQIQRLERGGLVVRKRDPSDGRAALVCVTRAGRSLLDRTHRVRGSMLAEFFVGWSERDVASVARALTRVAGCLAAPET